MKLLHCEISNFGCLSGLSLSFNDGFNLLYAPNGSGKSTLAVFIKAMLYGLPVTGKRDITENERKRYKPWNGGPYGGSLEFEAGGKLYRIERFFGAKEKDDTLAIYDLATGKPTAFFKDAPGLTLFGVDADGFERSLYLSQRFPFIGPDNNTIRARLGSLLDSSEDLGSFEMADGLLDDVRRYYMVNGGRGRIKDLSDMALAKEEEANRSREAAETATRLSAEEKTLTAEKEALQKNAEELREKRRVAERRQLLEEQKATYTRLYEAVEAEKRALAPLEDFFSAHLPSEKEIKATDYLLSEKTGALAKLTACRLTDEEEAARAAAEARIGDAATAENLFALKEADRAWRVAKDTANVSYPFDIHEFHGLDARFSGQVPTEDTINGVYAANQAFEEANANLYMAESEKKKAPSLPLLLSAASAVLCLVLSIVGFAFSVYPLGIVGGVCALVAVAAFVWFFLHRSKGRDLLAEDAAAKRDALATLLLPYGYTDKNPSVSASLFFTHIARYRAMRQEKEATDEAHRALIAEEEAKRATLSRLLALFAEEDPEEGPERVTAEATAFLQLQERKADFDKKARQIQEEIDGLDEGINRFLAFFPVGNLSQSEGLDTVKQKLVLSRAILSRYQDTREKLKKYLSETGFHPDQPLPPFHGDTETLAGEEADVSRRLLSVTSRISAAVSERMRAEEIAALLPVKEAELSALAEEKKEAEHTLSLIQTTKRILSEAKEDLATRYLRDMEVCFDRYRDLLNQEDTERDKVFFDTDLALSTEKAGERRPVAVLSKGEQDLMSFCARLSLIDAIFTKETPILLLDDPFVNLDDENYHRAMGLLDELSGHFQIIYTVCTTARVLEGAEVQSL